MLDISPRFGYQPQKIDQLINIRRRAMPDTQTQDLTFRKVLA
jgi:hypothetical protein